MTLCWKWLVQTHLINIHSANTSTFTTRMELDSSEKALFTSSDTPQSVHTTVCSFSFHVCVPVVHKLLTLLRHLLRSFNPHSVICFLPPLIFLVSLLLCASCAFGNKLKYYKLIQDARKYRTRQSLLHCCSSCSPLVPVQMKHLKTLSTLWASQCGGLWPGQPHWGQSEEALKLGGLLWMPQCVGNEVSPKARWRLGSGSRLQLVHVVIQWWDSLLQALAFTGLRDDQARLGLGHHGVAGQNLPVVKHALWEGLAASVGSQVSSEAYTRKMCNSETQQPASSLSHINSQLCDGTQSYPHPLLPVLLRNSSPF